jgi:enamine deaminase RidA (YjgF/YER057c/UK114 family)
MAAFAKGEHAMRVAGSSRQDVVRTRMYITRIEDAEAVGRAHKAFFGDVMPVATMVQVTAFVAKEALVEVEMDGVVGSGSDQ